MGSHSACYEHCIDISENFVATYKSWYSNVSETRHVYGIMTKVYSIYGKTGDPLGYDRAAWYQRCVVPPDAQC